MQVVWALDQWQGRGRLLGQVLNEHGTADQNGRFNGMNEQVNHSKLTRL